MKLLFFSWKREFTINDIINAFNKAGILFDKIELDVSGLDKTGSKEIYDLIDSNLKKKQYDALFSINYFPDLAKAAYENEVLYISWSYDCPLGIDNVEDTLSLKTNRAFFFDRFQYEQYMNDNNTVFHFPLAVDAKRWEKLKFESKFSSDVSFIGSVYASPFHTVSEYLDDYYVGYLKGIIEAQRKLYGTYISKDALDEAFMEKLNINLKKHNSRFTNDGNMVTADQIAYTLAREATFENRLLCLGLISNHFDLKWYTYEESQTIGKIKKAPPVDYDTEMPAVFYSSKINLHIGLHSIPSGISQRQLDIMSCGGFLLSSYQPELFDYFIPGEDFDYFTCAEEALDKCSFYLANEELRKKIAVAGREKTNSVFSYDTRIKELLDIAFNQ